MPLLLTDERRQTPPDECETVDICDSVLLLIASIVAVGASAVLQCVGPQKVGR